MKRSAKLALGIATAAAAGYLVYRLIHRFRSGRRLREVSEEGYETAHDVLFPRKKSRGKQKYGPVF